MWKKYQPNPCGRSVGDCAVRAVSAALNTDWRTAYDLLCDEGKRQCDVMNADTVWGAVLQQYGFRKWSVPYNCNKCYTAEMFCEDNPYGVFVLAFGGHVATVVDGVLLDAWNSSKEAPIYLWGQPRPRFR